MHESGMNGNDNPMMHTDTYGMTCITNATCNSHSLPTNIHTLCVLCPVSGSCTTPLFEFRPRSKAEGSLLRGRVDDTSLAKQPRPRGCAQDVYPNAKKCATSMRPACTAKQKESFSANPPTPLGGIHVVRSNSSLPRFRISCTDLGMSGRIQYFLPGSRISLQDPGSSSVRKYAPP